MTRIQAHHLVTAGFGLFLAGMPRLVAGPELSAGFGSDVAVAIGIAAPIGLALASVGMGIFARRTRQVALLGAAAALGISGLLLVSPILIGGTSVPTAFTSSLVLAFGIGLLVMEASGTTRVVAALGTLGALGLAFGIHGLDGAVVPAALEPSGVVVGLAGLFLSRGLAGETSSPLAATRASVGPVPA